jgi:hypothetical protein
MIESPNIPEGVEPMPSSFESDYPAITRWIKEFGRIEIQRRMREKDAPKRYRELVNRAVREMKPYLDEPTEERMKRLWSLFHEIEAEQNEYENIPWGVVRNVKSFDLLVVEHALKAVLRPYESSFWLYHAARDYTGKTDNLVPSSAPMVEEITGFWRKYFGIKR